MDELEEVVKNLKEQCASVRLPTPEMHRSDAAFLSQQAAHEAAEKPLACLSRSLVWSRRDWSSFAHLRDVLFFFLRLACTFASAHILCL